MKQIAVVYWSGTGNTQMMAEAVRDGAAEAGAAVTLFSAIEFTPESADSFDAIAFGCPSMGAEQLEETEFEPMFSTVSPKLSGKPVGLFGSYGWGDGEWMRTWEEECLNLGAAVIGAPVICCEAPDDAAIAACRKLGAALAQ